MSQRAYRKLLAASALVLAIGACTDLGVQPKSTVTTANIFTDPNSYQAFLAKLYTGLGMTGQSGPFGSKDINSISDEGFSGYLRMWWHLQEITTDEAVLAWGDAPIQSLNQQTWSPTNDFIAGMYARVYFQVGMANEFLRQTTPAKLSERGQNDATLAADVRMYRAEARFLRALAYYDGIDLYGNIPLVDENFAIGATPPAQATRAQIYTFIESELKAVRDSLPPSGPNSQYYGRATKAAADMLLAHLYLNAEVYTGTAHYDLARQYAESVIVHGGYSLAPRWQDNFLADNNTSPEMIFPIPSDGVHQKSYGNLTTIIHAEVGDNMNASAFGLNGGWYGLRTRPQWVQLYNGTDRPDTTSDVRAQDIFTSGHSFHIANLTSSGSGYAISKYRNVTKSGAAGSDPEFVDTDFPRYRLADAYLIYAEAVARGAGGSAGTAVGYVNALRLRAGASTISTAQLTPQFVLDERGRELYWEGYRRTDLIRFGQFTTSKVWEWKGGTQAGAVTDAHLNLFPLPAIQLSANPKLTQNPGY